MWLVDSLVRIARYLAPPEFTVSIRNGDARAVQGKITAKVLSEFSDVARQGQISRGYIYGLRRGNQTTLRFSSSIPLACRQRLRNIWSACMH